MSTFILKVKSFSSDEKGVTAIEYALLASLIAVVIAATVATLGASVLALYEEITAAFP